MIFQDVQRNKRRTMGIVFGFILFIALVTYFSSIVAFGPNPIFPIIALAFASISAFIAYYNSDKIILKLSNAREATREEHRQLKTIMEGLCIATGLPMPRLYIIEDPALNAFATGRNPENAVIAITTGLLEKLDKYELEAVMAHELAHVKNYDILLQTIVTVMVGFVVIISDFAIRMAFFNNNRSSDSGKAGLIILAIGLVFMILAPIFTALIRFALSRKREYLADATAVEITRKPDGLIRALQKLTADQTELKSACKSTANLYIVSPFKKKEAQEKKQQKTSLFATHPSIEDRVKALQNLQ